MASSDQEMRHLVQETCCSPQSSLQRQVGLTKLIRMISQKLWRENVPYYQDALQQTWIYFCQNLCEGITGRSYDPEKATLVTWLNAYLKRRLQDFYIETQKQKVQVISESSHLPQSNASNINIIDQLESKPDIPPLLEHVKRWVETDPKGELKRIHINQHPEITCQSLILKRLPPEVSWKVLATEYSVSISTLSSFYQRQCLPRLRKFGQEEGYL